MRYIFHRWLPGNHLFCMADTERHSLSDLHDRIEHAVKDLPDGQASQLRTRIWDSIVETEGGIVKLIRSHTPKIILHEADNCVKANGHRNTFRIASLVEAGTHSFLVRSLNGTKV